MLAAVSIAGCADAPDVAQYQFDRGLAFYGNGDFEQAIAAYSEAIRQQPEFAEAYYERGLARVQMGAFEAAVADYTQAIQLRPDYRQAYNNRAVAYAQQEQYAKAIQDCTKAIELGPDDDLAYRNRGLAYHDLGQFDKAIEDSTSAIRLNPASAEAYLNRGNAWLDKGGCEQAVADFSEAIRLDSELSKAFFSRAVAYEKFGEKEKAADDFRRAKQLNAAFDIPREYLALGATTAGPARSERGVESQGPSDNTRQSAIRKRAIEMARGLYEAEGYQVEAAPPNEPFELACHKGQESVYVEVKAEAGEARTVRLTPDEVRMALGSDDPVDLCVIGHIDVSPEGPPFTASGGKIIHHVRGWKPDEKELKPLAFEYGISPEKSSSPDD